jgi:hypothetical protein
LACSSAEADVANPNTYALIRMSLTAAKMPARLSARGEGVPADSVCANRTEREVVAEHSSASSVRVAARRSGSRDGNDRDDHSWEGFYLPDARGGSAA